VQPSVRRVSVVLCTLVLSAIATALGASSRSRTVTPLSLISLVVPTNARALGTTEEAVRGIAAIISSHLGLGVPDHLTVHVYGGRLAFEQGLIRDGRVSPLLAAEMSDFAIGVVTRGQVLLYDRPRDRSDREWLRLIAHELTHVAQIQLAGGEGRGEQWLAEGMAEWVAYSTLERLGLDSMGRRRMAATSGLHLHATRLESGLDLEARGTPRGFTDWHTREGALGTYQLAFLMTDYLIEQRGFDRMKAYFASFRNSTDRRGNFDRAFGETILDFEADVLAYLRTLSAL
jgi:hypothetical protein